MTEALCESCGNEAVARVRGEWLSARCGLHRTTIAAWLGTDPDQADGGPSRSWSKVLKAAIGSGLAAKVLIGAAALAAVGGAIVTDTPPVTAPPPSTPPVSVALGPPPTPVPSLPPQAADVAVAAVPEEHVPAAQDDVANAGPEIAVPDEVVDFLVEVNRWSTCIDETVHEFAASSAADKKGGFDFDDCGPRPDFYARTFAVGRPEEPGSQAADAAGKPEDPDKPEDAGMPDKPEDAGMPEDAGKPEDAGMPEDAGKPEEAGKPEDAGMPEDPGSQVDDVRQNT